MSAFSRLKVNFSVSKPDQIRPVKTGSSRKNIWWSISLIIFVTLVSAAISYPGKLPDSLSWLNLFPPKLGLDISGGAQLVYNAHLDSVPADQQAAALAGARDVIERRVNAFGVSEAVVQTAGSDKIIIELPGVTDVNEAVKQIGETPILEFKTENPKYGTQPTLNPEQQKNLDSLNAEVLKKAQSVLNQVLANKGATFADLAKQYSDDPGSASKGGDLDYVRQGQFVPEVDKAIFTTLKNGEISPVLIKSDFGYHIIQKLDERQVSEDDPKDANKKINIREVKSRHILLAFKKATDIVPTPDQWVATDLSGKNLQKASVVFEPNTGRPEVQVTFDATGTEAFKKITTDNLNKPVAIFLDGQVISQPTVRSTITNGVAVISGDFTITEAKLLAQRLNAGALPVPISFGSKQTVGPALGQDSLNRSLVAGLVGIIAVAVYMILFYRLPGLVAVVALGIYALVSLALFELLGFTLTLAGIAGFILSIGMAVDANILIFSRLREELSSGKTISDSIEEGFVRAWNSIRDSNISSLITCAILVWFGTSVVKGFALTLGLGIIVSMFSAIVVTRTLLRILPAGLKRHHWLFGVKS